MEAKFDSNMQEIKYQYENNMTNISSLMQDSA